MLASSEGARTRMVTWRGVAGEVQGGLPGGVAPADDVHVLPRQRRGLRHRAAVEDAGAGQRVELGDLEPPVAGPGCDDDDLAPIARAAVEADREAVVRAREVGHAVHEQEPRTEERRLLVGLLGEAAAADASRESEVVADERA